MRQATGHRPPLPHAGEGRGEGASGGAPAAATHLLLIRHGETEWNTESRIQGFRDIALSARGLRQAAVLARHLQAHPIAAVYASDLARAVQTAEPLAHGRGGVRIDARLKERGFGIFEGHTYAEAEARWPHEYAIWRQRDPAHALPGGGESFLDARRRVLQCLDEIVRRHAGATVAVVTHGGVLDIVYRTAMGIAWETPRSHLLPNASINRVRASAPGPALEVLAWAERAHLDDAADDLG